MKNSVFRHLEEEGSDFVQIVGREIRGVLISDCGRYLCFLDNNSDYYVYYAWGECCSGSWFESVNNVENVIGQTIISVEEKNFERLPQDEDGTYIISCGYTIKTLKGYCDIEFRNWSNGYYGGECRYVQDLKIDVDNGDFFIKEKDGEVIQLKRCQ